MFGRSELSTAERVDSRTGVREEAAFVPVGAHGEQMLTYTYQPAGEPVGQVLIAPSIMGDFLANYRREVVLARSLAAAGIAVVRFHYRGTGNSFGDPAQITLASLAEDATYLAHEMVRSLPAVPIGFIGTRWGALSAAAAANDFPGAPLALCEPLTDFSRFYSDAMRSRAMSAIATGKSVKAAKHITDLLARDGKADIVGNVLYPALHTSTVGVDPVQLLTEGDPRPRFLVQFGGNDLRPAHRKLEKEFTDRQLPMDTVIVDVAESWWFRPDAPTLVPIAQGLNDSLLNWLQAELSKSAQLEQQR